MVEIKCRFTGRVLFAHDVGSIKIAVEAAVLLRADLSVGDLRGADLSGAYLSVAYLRGADLSGAYLRGADLSGADLSGAYLSGADLSGAYLSGGDLRGADLRGAYLSGGDLRGADLSGAYLSGAYLSGAYLSGGDLRGADLSGAYLRGADLSGADLDGGEVATGARPVLQIGPIGSRSAYLIAWMTRSGVFIRAGCFWGTRDEFAEKVKTTHGDSVHAQEYAAALVLIDAHAKLWTPKGGE